MVYQEIITINTKGHHDIHDITQEVQRIVKKSGVKTGIAHIFNQGNTAAIGALEFEPGLTVDLPELLDKLIPQSRSYHHEETWHDGNGHSHLQATLLGEDYTVPISNGSLALGTWQQLFHLECDIKPRVRKIFVTIIGE